MFYSFLILLAGFFLLMKGADWLVEGSSNMAKRLGVSSLIIGLTVVAFGTSLPELAVSVLAAFRGESEIALGNVIGSNFANIGLILGISALIYPLAMQSATIWKEIPFALASALLVVLLAFDSHTAEGLTDLLSWRDGIILLIYFVIFLYYIFSTGMAQRKMFFQKEPEVVATTAAHMKWRIIIAFVLSGLAMVVAGGELVVRSAVVIARNFGLSDAFIGSTIIAVGTSLPELITSVTAAMKKQADIAVGNIVGSNIFNALFILGVASMVHPLSIDPALWRDGIFMICITTLLWLFSGIRHTLSRTEGSLLLITYIGYIGYIMERQGLFG